MLQLLVFCSLTQERSCLPASSISPLFQTSHLIQSAVVWKESRAADITAAADNRNFTLEASIGSAYLSYVGIKRCGHPVLFWSSDCNGAEAEFQSQCWLLSVVTSPTHAGSIYLSHKYPDKVASSSSAPHLSFSCYVLSLFLSLSFVPVLLQSSLDQSWNEGFQFIFLSQADWEKMWNDPI